MARGILIRLYIWLRCGLRSALGGRGIWYIGGADTLPQPLSAQEEAVLIRDCRSDETRRILIERNLRLVVYIARKFENSGVGLEDLISIGTIGLIKAVGTYDAEKNIKLATYASRCIENEILMFLRKSVNRRHEISIDEPLNRDSDGNELLLSDILGTDADCVSRPIEEDVDKLLLRRALEKLGERERKIICMRYGLGLPAEMTQKEVADAMGISQSYISRLEKRIIAKLRKEMAKYD